MRLPAPLAPLLAVLLPFACTASAPKDPPSRAAVAPAVATTPEPAPVIPVVASEPTSQISEPGAPEPTPVAAGPVDDCGLRATITSERGEHDTTKYTLTLKNEGTAARTLVTPGDGSEDGRRTPMLVWSGTQNGKPAPQLERPGCGMMNAIEASEIFTLAPGASRAMSTWIHGPSYGPGRYEVQLRYTNDPGNTRAAESNPEVAAMITRSSACAVTSAPLTIQVK